MSAIQAAREYMVRCCEGVERANALLDPKISDRTITTQQCQRILDICLGELQKITTSPHRKTVLANADLGNLEYDIRNYIVSIGDKFDEMRQILEERAAAAPRLPADRVRRVGFTLPPTSPAHAPHSLPQPKKESGGLKALVIQQIDVEGAKKFITQTKDPVQTPVVAQINGMAKLEDGLRRGIQLAMPGPTDNGIYSLVINPYAHPQAAQLKAEEVAAICTRVVEDEADLLGRFRTVVFVAPPKSVGDPEFRTLARALGQHEKAMIFDKTKKSVSVDDLHKKKSAPVEKHEKKQSKHVDTSDDSDSDSSRVKSKKKKNVSESDSDSDTGSAKSASKSKRKDKDKEKSKDKDKEAPVRNRVTTGYFDNVKVDNGEEDED